MISNSSISLAPSVGDRLSNRLKSSGLAAVFTVATLVAAVTPLFLYQSASAATTETRTVTADNTQGWAFNPSPANATPYEFTEDKASIGNGSLFVLPIGTTAAHKFIATKPLNNLPAEELTSVSYDFLIAGDGTELDSNKFYLNVYAILPGTTETFYNCRFDYEPTIGSTAAFTTASFSRTTPATTVTPRNTTETCPTTLAGLPAGSKINFISLNVGDTTDSDAGLAGYLDNVVITTTSGVTTYDFEVTEPAPTPPPPAPATFPENKDDCKNNGFKTFTGQSFRNQGQCVKYVEKNSHKVRGHIRYTAGIERRAWFDMNTANDRGWFVYADANRDWYRVSVSDVDVSTDGKTAWFAGEVVRSKNNKFDGQWLFAKVEDGNPDKISGSFTTQALAEAGVNAKSQPADGPFNVIRGHIRIKD